MGTVRSRLDEWEGGALLVALGCAGILLLAIIAPTEFARTTWGESRADGGYLLADSPAGYVGLVSLCGFVAFAALVIAAWLNRTRLVAALLAAAAFAYAAWVAVSYSQKLAQGIMGLEGRLDFSRSNRGADAPELLPFFVLVSLVGALVALLYAGAAWPLRAERD